MERASSLSNSEPLDEPHPAAKEEKSRPKSSISRLWSPLSRLLGYTIFSSLPRRIVVLYLAALAALVDEEGRLEEGAWLRLPMDSRYHAHSPKGCTLYLKTGGLHYLQH